MWILLTENRNVRKKSNWIFDFIDFKNINVIISILLILFILIWWIIFIFFKFYLITNFDKFMSTVVDYNKSNIIIEWYANDNLILENDDNNLEKNNSEIFKWLNFQEKFLKDVEKKVKKISENKQKDLVWKLNYALPDVLEKEFVIKFFEDLFLTISSKDSPVVLNSINIWSAVWNSINLWNSEKINYKKYPISLWFSCLDKDFNRILDIIQVSWLFDKRYYFRWEILPVMTVSSVTMNFDKDFSEEKKEDVEKSRSLQIFMYSYWDKKSDLKK